MKQHDLTTEMTVRPEFLGLELLLMPAPQHVSSQRAVMWSSHCTQAMVLNNAEFPIWFTGWESIVSKYPFRSAGIKEPVMIHAVVPKYTHINRTNPSILVIYVGLDSKKIGCFTINRYVNLRSEFGYETRRKNASLLFPGTVVQPGTEFEESVNHDGEMYNMGLNVNIAYMTRRETTDDAVGISQRLADATTHTKVGMMSIVIEENDLPLNLYGNSAEYKIMPYLDESVGHHGILLGLRRIVPDCFISDLTDYSLQTAQPSNDQLYRLPAGTKIVDVDVFLGKDFGRNSMSCQMYDQLVQYNEQSVNYWMSIVKAYFDLTSTGYKPDNMFNDLVTRAICMLGLESRRRRLEYPDSSTARRMRDLLDSHGKKKDFVLANKKNPVNFIQIDVMYTYVGKIGIGSKITGRDGAKGVVSRIVPNDQMPVDEYGNQADLIQDPTGGFNRLNPSQFYEQYICRVSQDVKKQALAMDNDASAYKHILEFFEILSPTYASIVKDTVHTPSQISTFLNDVETKGLHFCIPPYTFNNLRTLVRKLKDRYGVVATHLTFNQVNPDGSITRITTKRKFMVGPKYITLLGKIPGDDLTALESAYVNQHQLPIKIGGATKNTQSISRTPIKIGEDETSLMGMSIGSESLVRILGVHANSPKAFIKLCEQLLCAPSPTRLEFVQGIDYPEIVNSMTNVGMLNHALGAIGIKVLKPNRQG